MPDGGERLDHFEARLGDVGQRLGSVETGLKEVRDEVGGLREEVGDLRREVSGLRIIGEENADDIKKIAEVQSHQGRTLDDHGKKLDAIARALEPLSDMQDFIRRIAPNHELRIEALEKHTRIPH
jgi:archaellum component FlaC